MEITNRTEKRIYELVLQRIYITPERYCLLTNVEIGKILDVSPITVRDKIIKLRKKGLLECRINYFDDNNKYFARQILKPE
jgi:Mn-dependent DtxR family transcriptional regulator